MAKYLKVVKNMIILTEKCHPGPPAIVVNLTLLINSIHSLQVMSQHGKFVSLATQECVYIHII